MPCEGCHVQFTVFKRKRSCGDCKRYYCHNCLVSTRKLSLCERCLLFSRRPLQRSDLVKLRTKDLIFYLQSKHISTAGCVEKEDLIELVIQCVERMDGNQSSSGDSSKSSSKNTTPQHNAAPPPLSTNAGNRGSGAAGRRSFDNANSFDNIKQTCQNFFSSLSDNISDSFANLESRACSKTRPERATDGNDNTNPTNVTEQPRVATREIPTYASRQQRSTSGTNSSQTTPSVRSPTTPSRNEEQPQQQAVQTPAQSPIRTTEATAETPATQSAAEQTADDATHQQAVNTGDCECSDDELIATFSTRTRSPKSTNELNMPLSNDEADPATCAPSTSASTSKPSSQHSKLEIYINDEEESSHSSFEELGAIGGISDDSKTTTDTTSNTTDQWQMLDLKQDAASQQPMETGDGNTSTTTAQQTSQASTQSQESATAPPATGRVKKVTRRRSESYLNRRRPQYSLEDEDDEIPSTHAASHRNPSHARIEEETQTATTTAKQCCMRCGKNKVNIRQQVERMRQHLQSSQMSEADIKEELVEFLAYLEQRTKSVEYSDSDAGASTPSTGRVEATMPERHYNVAADTSYAYFAEMEASASLYEKGSRFINLDDYDSL